MDIVSNIPFTLQLIKRYPSLSIQEATNFREKEEELWNDKVITISMEENDEVELLFHSSDSDARLYLEALDIIPLDISNIKEDEEGNIYRMPSKTPFTLYKSDGNYDSLRVDIFKISIVAHGKWYYGTFQILPKPMSDKEWSIMKSDLENEIRGLAQDIVRKNMGIGRHKKGDLPPQNLYNFLIIKKYATNIIASLADIADNPRYRIVTEYQQVPENKISHFNSETVKRYIMRSGSESTFKVPKKVISFDIQENRLLKKIILEYEEKLNDFIKLIETHDNSFNSGGSIQYENEWKRNMIEFREEAYKLRKITSIIKSKDWYQEVSNTTQLHIPHSFIMDVRYNTLRQILLKLKKNEIQVELEREFSYTWKRSSYMYEMWCFFKVCRILNKEFDMEYENWNSIIGEKVLFPFLMPGTCINFENDNTKIRLFYDNLLPSNIENTTSDSPLYMLKSHNRPDIILNIYSKDKNIYLGSVILECKYRKLRSFWSNESQRSSIVQLQSYYNNARSELLFNGKGKILNSIPIRKVIVLTPDIMGEGIQENNYNISVKPLKPLDNKLEKELKDILINEINKVNESKEMLGL